MFGCRLFTVVINCAALRGLEVRICRKSARLVVLASATVKYSVPGSAPIGSNVVARGYGERSRMDAETVERWLRSRWFRSATRALLLRVHPKKYLAWLRLEQQVRLRKRC